MILSFVVMNMEEEFVRSNNDLSQIIKGRRSKRQRSSSASSSTSGCGGGNDHGDCNFVSGGGGDDVVEDYGSNSPTMTSSNEEVYHEATEEEEDMANCLILLAQGDGPRQVNENNTNINSNVPVALKSKKFSEIATSCSTNKSGFYVYECKTCNRSFPSFQALGGHRASHKKPKTSPIKEKKPISLIFDIDLNHKNILDNNNYIQEYCQLNKSSITSTTTTNTSLDNSVSRQIAVAATATTTSTITSQKGSNNKSKVHECLICGSEFTSGQALGGHMRRHRQSNNNNNNSNSNNNTQVNDNGIVDGQSKQRNILPLDLNLPAPEDDHHHHHRESKFHYVASQPPLVFSATPALIDCHY